MLCIQVDRLKRSPALAVEQNLSRRCATRSRRLLLESGYLPPPIWQEAAGLIAAREVREIYDRLSHIPSPAWPCASAEQPAPVAARSSRKTTPDSPRAGLPTRSRGLSHAAVAWAGLGGVCRGCRRPPGDRRRADTALAGSAGGLRAAGGRVCRRAAGLPEGGGTPVSVHSRTPLQATAQKPPLRNGSRPLDGTPLGECTETGA
jgi:hypothetical protein